jgi:hypothetical protein
MKKTWLAVLRFLHSKKKNQWRHFMGLRLLGVVVRLDLWIQAHLQPNRAGPKIADYPTPDT